MDCGSADGRVGILRFKNGFLNVILGFHGRTNRELCNECVQTLKRRQNVKIPHTHTKIDLFGHSK